MPPSCRRASPREITEAVRMNVQEMLHEDAALAEAVRRLAEAYEPEQRRSLRATLPAAVLYEVRP